MHVGSGSDIAILTTDAKPQQAAEIPGDTGRVVAGWMAPGSGGATRANLAGGTWCAELGLCTVLRVLGSALSHYARSDLAVHQFIHYCSILGCRGMQDALEAETGFFENTCGRCIEREWTCVDAYHP